MLLPVGRPEQRLAQAALAQVTLIWRAFGLQLHRTETFKLSKDPLFIGKMVTVL